MPARRHENNFQPASMPYSDLFLIIGFRDFKVFIESNIAQPPLVLQHIGQIGLKLFLLLALNMSDEQR